MADIDLAFHFDPVCPFCWVTSQWVRVVQRQRELRVDWRFVSLRMLNDKPGGYADKPAGYRAAHGRGLELLRVAAAARDGHGNDAVSRLYQALGEAIWEVSPPDEPDFEAILRHTARAGDVEATLDRVGLPRDLAAAAQDPAWDDAIRADTEQALEQAGDDVGTPVLAFAPPDGPAFFGPVISQVPPEDQAVRLWEAVETLAHWPTFAELKRAIRTFPHTAVTAKLAGSSTTVS